MKWYDPMECDNTVKEPLVCDFNNLSENGYSKYSFFTGMRIDNWKSNIFFQAKKKRNNGEPDDVLQSATMLPIYSPRMINALKLGGIEGIQYLPIEILQSSGEITEGFCIANILNLVGAFDEEKSVFRRFSRDFPNPNVRGKITGIRKSVLRKEMLTGCDIIRLKESNLCIYVSEKFKDIFEQNGFTGYSFSEIELS